MSLLESKIENTYTVKYTQYSLLLVQCSVGNKKGFNQMIQTHFIAQLIIYPFFSCEVNTNTHIADYTPSYNIMH